MTIKFSGVIILFFLLSLESIQAGLPRIGVRSGTPFAEFYNTKTGETFKPIGSSYVRLHKVGENVFHSTFGEGEYEPERADSALRKMAKYGYNVVRVWCYHGHFGLRPIRSVEGKPETNTPELYQPYIDNLVDFLKKATRHKIYVQLAIDRTPQNKYYLNMVNKGFQDVEGVMNREYMVPDAIAAKEIYIDQLIQSVKKRDSGLLSTIFGYEIRNEIHSESDKDPFKRSEGKVNTAAGVYDMGDAASRQACQDDNVTLFLNRCVDRIRQNDSQALTTSSIFTFSPVKKTGSAGNGLLMPINVADYRWPIRPNVLVKTNLDYIDVHNYYPHDWNKGLESSDWKAVDKTVKPFVAGEFGAHRRDFSNVNDAAKALLEYRTSILNSGFQGAYLFTWDTYEHTRWTMLEAGEVIKKVLSPKK